MTCISLCWIFQAASQIKAGQAVLALGQVVDRGKPSGQRQFGGMKDRAGDQRHLMAARRALLDRAGPEDDRVGSSAFRADETPRPAPREQRRPALLLGAVLRPTRRAAQQNAASLNPFWNCTTFLAILTSR